MTLCIYSPDVENTAELLAAFCSKSDCDQSTITSTGVQRMQPSPDANLKLEKNSDPDSRSGSLPKRRKLSPSTAPDSHTSPNPPTSSDTLKTRKPQINSTPNLNPKSHTYTKISPHSNSTHTNARAKAAPKSYSNTPPPRSTHKHVKPASSSVSASVNRHPVAIKASETGSEVVVNDVQRRSVVKKKRRRKRRRGGSTRKK